MEMTEEKTTTVQPAEPGCNVNSTFNFSVGALAIAAAIAIAYFVYRTWIR
jgi:hypothetical protein